MSRNNKIIAVIPTRYKSSRFEGKPLADINGKPMIWWVYNQVSKVIKRDDIYIATDDDRIFNAVVNFNGNAIKTGEFLSGTDRVASVCNDLEFDIALNIQGDEPLIHPEAIQSLIDAFQVSSVNMATLKKEISGLDITNPNIAKVITDINNDAIYFSRASIPFDCDKKYTVKYYKHIGIYAYRKEFIKKFSEMNVSFLEQLEKLEQLRVIENGHKIRVVETNYDSIGVDLSDDIEKVKKILSKGDIDG